MILLGRPWDSPLAKSDFIDFVWTEFEDALSYLRIYVPDLEEETFKQMLRALDHRLFGSFARAKHQEFYSLSVDTANYCSWNHDYLSLWKFAIAANEHAGQTLDVAASQKSIYNAWHGFMKKAEVLESHPDQSVEEFIEGIESADGPPKRRLAKALFSEVSQAPTTSST